MKKRFMSAIILLCVFSVGISVCAEPEAPPDGMVLIPAGEFEMGSNDAEAHAYEQPVHTVYVDAFYMDKYEVTVGQYMAFVQATGHRALNWGRVGKYSPMERHPIVDVSWHDAMAYARWAGKRLPTEGRMGEGSAWRFVWPNLSVGGCGTERHTV